MADSDRTGKARAALLKGAVIPAHPLALTAERRLDERRQAALTRYYCEAGARGIAVGVHTTQFAIRERGLLRPVLSLAAQTALTCEASDRGPDASARRSVVRIAGVCGATPQALAEAALAIELGYDAALLSLSALSRASNDVLIAHCRRVAEILPSFGFYLQPAVGGRVLDYGFWRAFLEIDAVLAIKVAPFDRYATLEVARAVADSGRGSEVALYTGNDDAIVADLLAELDFGDGRKARFAGGLLGQWAVWTRSAVDLLQRAQACRAGKAEGLAELLALGHQLTDANSALFDSRNRFAGCIAGIHEVLRRQGLLAGRYCLDPHEDLSPGQEAEIDRVLEAYPHLADDDFVAANLDRWLR